MKTAVIILLFLAVVVECRFMTRYAWPRFRYQTYQEPEEDICTPFLSSRRNYIICKVMDNFTLSCDDLKSFFNSIVPEFSAASEHLYGANRCDQAEEKEAKRPVCGQSPTLERTEGGGRGLGMGRIVGGQMTRNCTVIPWQVQVKPSYNLCGGSIISENHVLTAAHCVEEFLFYPSEVTVVVGSHNLRYRGVFGQTIGVARIDVHEDYNNRNFDNDIAILHLNQTLDFTLNECVAPVCLNKFFEPTGQNCTVSGWGAIRFRGPISPVLKMAQVKTHKGEECEEAFSILDNTYVVNKTKQICAGFSNGGIDSCQGDSGGPLVCLHKGSYVQAGVVSNGRGCAFKHMPGLYTNVAYFLDWIEEKTGINSAVPDDDF